MHEAIGERQVGSSLVRLSVLNADFQIPRNYGGQWGSTDE